MLNNVIGECGRNDASDSQEDIFLKIERGAERLEKHKRRMESDPEYRRQQESEEAQAQAEIADWNERMLQIDRAQAAAAHAMRHELYSG